MVKYFFVILMVTCQYLVAKEESGYLFPGVTVFEGKTFDLEGIKDEILKIKSLPLEKYQIYHVPNLGSFYIDYLHDTIKKTLSEGYIWEPNIVELIKKHVRKGSVAIDLGSHIGTHLLSMSKAAGKEGQVIGFEPQIKIFSELVQNMVLNQCQNVRAYRCAVGREFKQVQMRMAHSSNEGGTPIGYGGDLTPLIPLDALKLENVSLIKIDVEGYEDEVLVGAQETIKKNRPFIIIELMDGNKQLDKKRDATIKSLESMGYKLNKLWGWDWFASPIE